jgi:predicted hotdog family 3-hydroxylacyl-ACP dehydratase
MKIENITEIIPQKAPFVMIDNLKKADETGFETDFLIKEDNLFLEEGRLSESSLTENIAQTCAAGFGYLGMKNEDKEPKIGFIGAISKLTNLDYAKIGDKINTKVEILNSFESIHLIQGKCYNNDQLLLECQMKIVQL